LDEKKKEEGKRRIRMVDGKSLKLGLLKAAFQKYMRSTI